MPRAGYSNIMIRLLAVTPVSCIHPILAALAQLARLGQEIRKYRTLFFDVLPEEERVLIAVLRKARPVVSEADASCLVIGCLRRTLFADTSMVIREKVQSGGEECMENEVRWIGCSRLGICIDTVLISRPAYGQKKCVES